MDSEQDILEQFGDALIENHGEDILNILELPIDAFLNDDVIKELPILHSIYSIFKTGAALREYYLRAKLLKFIAASKSIDYNQEKWDKFRDRMNSDHVFFKRMLAETVVFAERQFDEEKSVILGLYFSAFINEKISYEKFRKLMMTLDMFLLQDAAVLKKPAHFAECWWVYQ